MPWFRNVPIVDSPNSDFRGTPQKVCEMNNYTNLIYEDGGFWNEIEENNGLCKVFVEASENVLDIIRSQYIEIPRPSVVNPKSQPTNIWNPQEHRFEPGPPVTPNGIKFRDSSEKRHDRIKFLKANIHDSIPTLES